MQHLTSAIIYVFSRIQNHKLRNKEIWREKEKSKESLIIQTTFNAQKKASPWIINNGCSSHMTGDKQRFEKLQKYEGGSVKFENNDGAKIIGKGIVKVCGGRIKSEEVLFVVGLKHNLLSVS